MCVVISVNQGIYLSSICLIISAILQVWVVGLDADDYDWDRNLRVTLKVIFLLLELVGLWLLMRYNNIAINKILIPKSSASYILEITIGIHCVKELMGMVWCIEESVIELPSAMNGYIVRFIVLLSVSLIIGFIQLG